jgi:hypothetical protein
MLGKLRLHISARVSIITYKRNTIHSYNLELFLIRHRNMFPCLNDYQLAGTLNRLQTFINIKAEASRFAGETAQGGHRHRHLNQ